jgi:hypothetical protein
MIARVAKEGAEKMTMIWKVERRILPVEETPKGMVPPVTEYRQITYRMTAKIYDFKTRKRIDKPLLYEDQNGVIFEPSSIRWGSCK